MRARRRTTVREDLIKGAIAGAVATWLMGKVTGARYARGGSGVADKAAMVLGTRLGDEQRERLAAALHWALGIGAGAAYALLRRRFSALGRGSSLGVGTAFWAAVDEGLVPALGLTPGPKAFPWQAHARGLAGHLTFGTVTDRTLRLLDAIV
jgi:uncharacterized membrane protein YagU involved in acid resistance